jgi:glutamate-1-semialdehyde 2,1-aminomutase
VIGGGLPVGAFGATTELMAHLAPLGGVYQAGTLSGNPLATAAGLAVLSELDDAAFATLDATAARLADGLAKAFADAGVEVQVPRVGALVGLAFGPEVPTDYDQSQASVALGRYPSFFHGMLDRDVALAPGPYEVMFPSLAHTPDDIAATVAAATAAAATLGDEG